MLETGDRMPDVTLPDDEGREIRTSALLGEKLIVYFYPKDDTPGCTTEATAFRDLYQQLKKKKTRVVGVSRASVESHKKFKKKYDLPFTLLSDTESKLCDTFGVIVEKNMYGKKSKGIQRATFLIEVGGTIVKVWPKVKAAGHAQEVLLSLD